MNNHPDKATLSAYANGDIDAVSGLVIAIHLEQCAQCREHVSALEQSCSEDFELVDVFPTSGGDEESVAFSAMLESIMELEPVVETHNAYEQRSVSVNSKEFTLPKPLWRFADLVGEWRSYGGKVFSAEVALGEDARVSLMYIGEDVQIPQHTHKGQESTLVLHGGFSDEEGHYGPGDLLMRDASHKHSPFTKPGEECLCLTVLTEPMLFTQGVARIFNMFGKGLYP